MESRVPRAQLWVPLYIPRTALSAQPPPSTLRPLLRLLQGIRVYERFMAQQQQTLLLQPVYLQDSLSLASIQGSNCPMCWLNGSYMCTHSYTPT